MITFLTHTNTHT